MRTFEYGLLEKVERYGQNLFYFNEYILNIKNSWGYDDLNMMSVLEKLGLDGWELIVKDNVS